MVAFDYKKEYKDLYLPKDRPSLIDVPAMHYVAVRGKGNPNDEDGEYSAAIGVLYSISYTIKMSYKNNYPIDGYFQYVVPPLEGFWWMGDGAPGVDYSNKSGFNWISVIRLPDFVTETVFEWAKAEASVKKKIDVSKAELLTVREGLCVQCLHLGKYDGEPATVAKISEFAEENGYKIDITDLRRHHEIYLSDPRKTSPDKLKTVIRHPVAKI